LIIYPAIDIRAGKCVRLVQGNYNQESVYSQNPIEVALGFEKSGAEYIHLVDLDGAKSGRSQNLGLIVEIAAKLSIPVQLGGGIRTMDNIEEILASGVHRVILGTAAVNNPKLVKQAVEKYKDKIAVGIDARNGKAAIEGWLNNSDLDAVEFGKIMEDIGVETIIYTDISRDGMLIGPNLSAMEEMVNAVKIRVIASGGVAQMDDLMQLKETGVEGVIIGKAIYAGNIKLEEAIRIVSK
jgi:phosphoribosylformimino-5-aminoimidazole carboxamide ribotide isomerase